jgi:hypothetical protein
MECFNLTRDSGIIDAKSSIQPAWILKFLAPTALTAGITAAVMLGAYGLLNYSMDAIVPGKRKPFAKTTAALSIAFIVVFGSAWVIVFCIAPTWWLIHKKTGFVLSHEYGKVIKDTPWISDVYRRKTQSDSRILMIIVLVIVGLLFAGAVWSCYAN